MSKQEQRDSASPDETQTEKAFRDARRRIEEIVRAKNAGEAQWRYAIASEVKELASLPHADKYGQKVGGRIALVVGTRWKTLLVWADCAKAIDRDEFEHRNSQRRPVGFRA